MSRKTKITLSSPMQTPKNVTLFEWTHTHQGARVDSNDESSISNKRSRSVPFPETSILRYLLTVDGQFREMEIPVKFLSIGNIFHSFVVSVTNHSLTFTPLDTHTRLLTENGVSV